VRPQIVYKWQNPDYWRLINYFKQLTGIGGVLNTSFNLHGYPLVATLEQAIFTFENSGLKYLALENFLISKE
jgi:carbamoyltransferase